jgi:hypothetical protein
MKPKLVYEVLRQTSPRKMVGKKSLPPNRYNLLARDYSPAESVRSNLSTCSRSISVKRKNSSDGPSSQLNSQDSDSYASICGAGVSSQSQSPTNDQETEIVNEEIAKVSSICDKVSSEISKQEVDPALISIFSGILDAMAGIVKTQTLLNNKKGQYASPLLPR